MMNEEDKKIEDWLERLQMQRKIDVDKNWKQLHQRIHRDETKRRLLRIAYRMAAVLLLPALLLSGYLYQQLNQLESQPIAQVELTTAYGVVSKVKLSDGSEVWLNSGSKLIYPSRFEGEKRTVFLSGEAYFHVMSDRTHRFEVQTGHGLVVSAYGTEFNVQAYDDETDIIATLANGNIEVEQTNTRQREDLQPGEQLIYTKKEGKMQTKEASLLAETAWREGKIVFRRTPMQEVVRQLSRHFNVDIQLQGKELYEYTYSATFTTETLTEILDLLEKTAPIRCEIIHPEPTADYAFSKKKVWIHSLP
ncbi:hypothetical protein B5F77_05530 [Parabacteroides sp. An277]|uniref:FecR family protein n=1 Tax=Parabacteroides sp. An277 TaxID=1965619 RepID=UPI000B3ACF19|nr:FecR domain-containing protein [Parabacteroides sp. An277]OUO53533.1 hypothetical protein B5F77_05530 [Parabacteroides sp. An277]